MKTLLLTTLCMLFFSYSSFGQLDFRGFQPHPNQSFHLELGAGLVNSGGRFGPSYSIEPQYTFANNISIGIEINHKNFKLGDSNEPHKVNSFSPSFQIRGKGRPIGYYIGGRFGYYKVYEIDDEVPSSFGTMGAALNYGFSAWNANLGMEVSFYRPYGGSLALYFKLRF